MTRKIGENRRFTLLIMISVGVWGGFLALGAFLFGYDQSNGEIHLAPNALRGLIVLACVAGFLGVWAALLASRRAS